jgi:hypothetical protein
VKTLDFNDRHIEVELINLVADLKFSNDDFRDCVLKENYNARYVDEVIRLGCASLIDKDVLQLKYLQYIHLTGDALQKIDFSDFGRLVSVTIEHYSGEALSFSENIIDLDIRSEENVPFDLAKFKNLRSLRVLGASSIRFNRESKIKDLNLNGNFESMGENLDLSDVVELNIVSSSLNALDLSGANALQYLTIFSSSISNLVLPPHQSWGSIDLYGLPINRFELVGVRDINFLGLHGLLNLESIKFDQPINIDGIELEYLNVLNVDLKNVQNLEALYILDVNPLSVIKVNSEVLQELLLSSDKKSYNIEFNGSCNALWSLTNYGVGFTSFDFERCENINSLRLVNTSINQLDLRNMKKLEYLDLSQNPIAFDKILFGESVPTVIENPGCENSIAPSCRVQ